MLNNNLKKIIGWYNKSKDRFVCLSCFSKEKQPNNKEFKAVKERDLEQDIFTCDKCGKIPKRKSTQQYYKTKKGDYIKMGYEEIRPATFRETKFLKQGKIPFITSVPKQLEAKFVKYQQKVQSKNFNIGCAVIVFIIFILIVWFSVSITTTDTSMTSEQIDRQCFKDCKWDSEHQRWRYDVLFSDPEYFSAQYSCISWCKIIYKSF